MFRLTASTILAVFMYTGSSAQTDKNIQKQLKDPQTIENSAKADVFVAKSTDLEPPQQKADKRKRKNSPEGCKRKNNAR